MNSIKNNVENEREVLHVRYMFYIIKIQNIMAYNSDVFHINRRENAKGKQLCREKAKESHYISE